jgi:hypothetical protein
MKRALLTAIAALAAVYAVLVVWRQNERAAGLDFYVYYVNAHIAGRADVDNIYDRDVQARIGEEYFERAQRSGSELRKYDAQRRRFVDSVSSPFLYTCLRWVSRDYDLALRQYHVVVMAAFLAGCLLIARSRRLTWATAFALIAGLLWYYRGFEADLRVGNVNSLQLLALGAAFNVPSFAAGAIIGALVSFKPNLLIVPLLLLVSRAATRDWRRMRLELLGGLSGIASAVVAASINYGTPYVWVQWVSRANEFYHRLPTRTERNVTPALALFHEHGAWPSYALALLLTIATCLAIWRSKRADDVLIAGTAILIYLLSATVVWLHYMVLVIPVSFALLRWRATAVVALLALAAIAEEPFETLTGIAVYPNDARLLTPAFIALFVCALWKIAVRPPPSAPAPPTSSRRPEPAAA